MYHNIIITQMIFIITTIIVTCVANVVVLSIHVSLSIRLEILFAQERPASPPQSK